MRPPPRNYVTTRYLESIPTRRDALLLMQEICSGGPCALPPDTGKPLVLYGAGNLGQLARDHLAAIGRSVELVLDMNVAAYVDRPTWAGYSLRHPSNVDGITKAEATLVISIVTSPFAVLRQSLEQEGWYDIRPFYDFAEQYRDRHPLSNGWVSAALSRAEENEVREVLSRWDDDRSRADHLRFLAWRIKRSEWHFADAAVEYGNRFFIPQVAAVLNQQERVLDAGAHVGQFVSTYLHEVGGFSRLWAVEPDPTNRHELKRYLHSLAPEISQRIEVRPELLSARTEEVCFHAGLGYASQIAPSGQLRLMTTCLDDTDIAPTVVKLHLEGHELLTLSGARRMLCRERPIVMLTVYHNAQGISATAAWLMANLADYKFYLRAHGWCGTGLVAYAIPCERQRSLRS